MTHRFPPNIYLQVIFSVKYNSNNPISYWGEGTRLEILSNNTKIVFKVCQNGLYVNVIARAGVIFGIYFTSCRYSGG